MPTQLSHVAVELNLTPDDWSMTGSIEEQATVIVNLIRTCNERKIPIRELRVRAGGIHALVAAPLEDVTIAQLYRMANEIRVGCILPDVAAVERWVATGKPMSDAEQPTRLEAINELISRVHELNNTYYREMAVHPTHILLTEHQRNEFIHHLPYNLDRFYAWRATDGLAGSLCGMLVQVVGNEYAHLCPMVLR